MNRKRVLVYVQHLLGVGHLRRAVTLARAMAEQQLDVTLLSGGYEVPGLAAPGVRWIQLPPAAALDERFAVLVDAQGNAVNDAWRAHRKEALLGVEKQPSIHEWRQLHQTVRRSDERSKAFHVVVRRADHQIGARNGCARRFVAQCPRAARTPGRIGCFGNHVRNAERHAGPWSEPIGCLVVHVVGEPEIRTRRARSTLPVRDHSVQQLLALRAQVELARGIAMRIEAAKV